MTFTAATRLIRKAYRKKLLPKIEQCLLGRGTPVAQHHSRRELDRQTASELLACFEGQTWLLHYSIDDLLALFKSFRDEQGEEVSIGKFARYLYTEQELIDTSWHDPVAVSAAELLERRMALQATLYIAGFLAEFEPESVPETA